MIKFETNLKKTGKLPSEQGACQFVFVMNILKKTMSSYMNTSLRNSYKNINIGLPVKRKSSSSDFEKKGTNLCVCYIDIIYIVP